MGKRMRKLKNVRLHREGTDTLFYGLLVLVAVAMVLWIYVDCKAFFWSFIIVFGTVYGVVVNFSAARNATSTATRKRLW